MARKIVDDLSKSVDETMEDRIEEGGSTKLVFGMLLLGLLDEADRLGVDFDGLLSEAREEFARLPRRSGL